MPLLVVVAFVSSARVRALICGAAAVVCAVIDPPGVIVSGERERFFSTAGFWLHGSVRAAARVKVICRGFFAVRSVCVHCARERIWSFCKDG